MEHNQTIICTSCGTVLTVPQNFEDGNGRFVVRCPNAECHREYSRDQIKQILGAAAAHA